MATLHYLDFFQLLFSISHLAQVKHDLRDKHAVLLETDRSYLAQLGDTVVVDLKGYDRCAPKSGGASKKSEDRMVASAEKLQVNLVLNRTFVLCLCSCISCALKASCVGLVLKFHDNSNRIKTNSFPFTSLLKNY